MSYQYYFCDNTASAVKTCLQMALVPWTNGDVAEECRNWDTWMYIGTCRAFMLRIDLETAIQNYLRHHHCDTASAIVNAETLSTSPSVHWHINVYMDSIIDERHLCVSISTCLPSEHLVNSPMIDDRTWDSTVC
jgi:hypothetical protein